ncbi:MAG: hypothetical protein M3N95_17905, partial [Actinomycetota bacterium]|nr:hypothetical protein [Actinomycetota bacterium]
APVQIGNRVWFDTNHNGIQDAGEPSVPGVSVKLHDGGPAGPVVASTTTSSTPGTIGEYYFGGVGAAYQLIPGHDYTVEFDVSTAVTTGLPGAPPASTLRYTVYQAGTNTAFDSNVPPPTSGALTDGFAAATAPTTAGTVDHTIDAGVYVVPTGPTTSPSTPPTSPSTPPTSPATTPPITSPPTATSTPPVGVVATPNAKGLAINTGGPQPPRGPRPWLILAGAASMAAGGWLVLTAIRRRPKRS